MESLLSLLDVVSTAWLSPGCTTWAMNMMFAFLCGLGLFYLLLSYLQFNPPSPPAGKSKNIGKVVKWEQRKTRKKMTTVKAYRGDRKAGKRKQKLLSFPLRFHQLLRGDTSREMLKPASAKAQQLPSQPMKDAFTNTLSLVGSSAPLKSHLLPVDSTLSPGLPNSQVSIESQSSLKGSDNPLNPLGNMLQSMSIKQHITTPHPFWSRNSKPKQFPGHQKLSYQDLGDSLNHRCSQLFWGLPFLHSESLMSAVGVSEGNVSTQPHTYSLVGRCWHHATVLGSWISNPETSPSLGMGWREPQSEHEAQRDLYHGVTVPEISMTSRPLNTRDTREMEEAEEEFCGWAVTMGDRDMANSQTNNEHLRNLESLETSESAIPSRTISPNAGDSSLSTPHHSATGIFLQDCATGIFLEDCAPEVLLAADILASQASLSRFKTISKSPSQDKSLLSREESGPKIPKVSQPWTNHIFGPTDKKEISASPRQDVRPSGVRSTKACQSGIPENKSSSPAEKKFGARIKNFIMSIFPPKGKVQENLLRKVKASSATAQNQGSVIDKMFMPLQVAEAKDLMSSVGWILEEKMGVQHACALSRKTLHKEPPQAPVSRHVCCNMKITSKSKRMQGNKSFVQANPKIHSQPSTNRQIRYVNNQVQQPVSQPSHWPHKLGQNVHCPRHCLCRNVISGKEYAFSHVP
ncbi:spermatogenesis-associated protein 31-like [Nannospalax galili]|uniref:spermatogenesis-associated protein 31-like n=1 Tax=Nannospalax galili TaxID=1026970 RepID=UPI00111C6AB7|nr:spermatogenesis-associated protein 31-like [Nannospalax galili]